MNEIWKDVVGYEGIYQVSNKGRVKGLYRKICKSNGVIQYRKERIISQCLNGDGYYHLKISKDGKSKTVRVHRLVAEAFIPNPNPKLLTDVNHIDYNRKNNNVSNLEWLSFHDNIRHSAERGHYKKNGTKNGRCVKIKLLDKDNVLIKEFDYIKECCEYIKELEKIETKISSIHDSIKKHFDGQRNAPYLGKYYFEKNA